MILVWTKKDIQYKQKDYYVLILYKYKELSLEE